MRHGVPLAGNFLYQELAIVTGAVDAMVVDVQGIMQSLPDVAQCYHTKIITTSPKAKIPGAEHIEFNQHHAMKSAKALVRAAVDNFPRRGKNIDIPQEKSDLVAGFSHETINYLLGGLFPVLRPPPERQHHQRQNPRWIAGVVGCNNPRV